MAENVAALPQIVLILLGYGRRLVPSVHARIERGIRRLLALDAYLCQRAKRGRDIPFVEPRAHIVPAANPQPQKAPAPTKAPRARSRLYNMEELEAEVRRGPVGRTIARICPDLGVVPASYIGEMGNALLQVLEYYGGSLSKLFAIRLTVH